MLKRITGKIAETGREYAQFLRGGVFDAAG